MSHPSVAEIMGLAAGERIAPELREHLAVCSACRALAGLGAPLGDTGAPSLLPEGGAGDMIGIPVVDPAVYVRGEEIGDGRGGMGRAIRAWDRRLGRAVAIKELVDPRTMPEPELRALLR